MDKAQAFKVLGLTVEATEAEVVAAYRNLVSSKHPDHGGDAQEFHELRQAFKIAREASQEPTPCDTCQGKGSVVFMRGFHSTKLMCTDCGGSGFTIKGSTT